MSNAGSRPSRRRGSTLPSLSETAPDVRERLRRSNKSDLSLVGLVNEDEITEDEIAVYNGNGTVAVPPPKGALMTASTRLYVQQCKAFKMVPDPSVLTCLETGWHVLAISPNRAVEGVLLPLVDVLGGRLETCAHVRELRIIPAPSLRASRKQTFSGDIDARCLSKIFATNKTIAELNISHLGLGPSGVQEIASIIRHSNTLQVIRLCNNPGGRTAYKSLESALKENVSLRVLDVSSNRLGFDILQRLRNAAVRPLPMQSVLVLGHGNHVVEEMLNTLTHGLGFVVALFGVVALQWHATSSIYVWWSCLIYGCTLLLMYACSTVFHASFDSHPESFDFWKQCDHAAINLLIAGSVAPFIHVALRHSWLALFVSAFQWVAAFCGIAFGLYAAHKSLKYKLTVEMIINFAQGFAVVLLYDELKAALKPEWFQMILYAGACYVCGAVFFVAEHTVHPFAHAVWHIFVIAGSTIHYFAVLQFVMDLEKKEHTAGDTLSQVVCRIVSNDLPVLSDTIQNTLGVS